MVVSIPHLLLAKRPVLACLTVVIIVFQQTCTFSSSGQPLEGSGGSLNGVAEGCPEMVSKYVAETVATCSTYCELTLP